MVLHKENSVLRVSFAGGILGILAGSHKGRLEKAILGKNKDGWNLAEVIHDNPNLIIWVFRVLLLVLTLGFWTLSTGYILVFERPSGRGANTLVSQNGRREPSLTAVRGVS